MNIKTVNGFPKDKLHFKNRFRARFYLISVAYEVIRGMNLDELLNFTKHKVVGDSKSIRQDQSLF